MSLGEKLDRLKQNIEKLGSLAVAFSGGVDSTFLMKVAHDVLAQKAIAITVRSSLFSSRELTDTLDFAGKLGIKHVVADLEVFDIDGFAANPVNRCYFCKKEVFSKILEEAKRYNINYVGDGSNMDDLNDYRPGMMALKELGIISPLKEAGLTKEDIRTFSRQMNLLTWDKPAFACLASRFPYGHEITKEKLEMVDRAEQYLMDLGFKQMRVRHHGDVARIEVPASDRSKFFNLELLDRVYEQFKRIGFKYTALDLQGYRTGSLNEGITL